MSLLYKRLAAVPRGMSVVTTATHSGSANWDTNHTGENITSNMNTYKLAPIASLPVKWAVWESTNGALDSTTTANLDTSFTLARTRTVSNTLGGGTRLSPFKILLRVYCGLDSPLGGGSGGTVNWGVAAGIPYVSLTYGYQPLPWDATYRSTIQAFMRLIANYLATNDAAGIPKWQSVAIIPIMGPTGIGIPSTEMWAKYWSAIGTVDNSNSSPDRLAWDAITSFYPGSVTSQADKESYRQRRIEGVYRKMISDQLHIFPNNYHVLSFGEVQNDSLAIARALVSGRTYATGTCTATSGSTSVTFSGSSLLANGGIGAVLYKVVAGVKTRLGTVADITSNTACTLETGALAAAAGTSYSMELPPCDTGNGRLCAMTTNLQIDPSWRHSYNFTSSDVAEPLRAAKEADWPIILQTESWIGNYDTKWPTNTKAAQQISILSAIEDWNPNLIETSATTWSNLENWMNWVATPILKGTGRS